MYRISISISISISSGRNRREEAAAAAVQFENSVSNGGVAEIYNIYTSKWFNFLESRQFSSP